MPINKTELWMHLAGLFFSGEPVDESELINSATLLKSMGWNRKQTEKALLEIIAPHAKQNLGYGIPPAIGEDDLLEPERLIPLMLRSEELRHKHSWKHYFLITDWMHRKLLRKLNVERLLRLLDEA